MAKRNTKSYSKFTYNDLNELGLEVNVVDLFEGQTIAPMPPSDWLKETLAMVANYPLGTEKAKSEFIIAPIINEIHRKNPNLFAIYSGYNFNVDAERGLQGFCDFLLAKLPLKMIPSAPIIAVVEAKLNDAMIAAVPQCAAEMYAARLWNEKRNEPIQVIYGIITNGDNWSFLRYKKGMIIEADTKVYPIANLAHVLGVLQHIVNQFK